MPIRDRLFSETCSIQRVSDTAVDERGLPSDTWSDSTTGVKAKFESQGAEEDRDGRNTTVETFIVFIESGVDVKPGDRLVRGSTYHEISIVRPVLDRYGNESHKALTTLVFT